jgi:hypothetical protein
MSRRNVLSWALGAIFVDALMGSRISFLNLPSIKTDPKSRVMGFIKERKRFLNAIPQTAR